MVYSKKHKPLKHYLLRVSAKELRAIYAVGNVGGTVANVIANHVTIIPHEIEPLRYPETDELKAALESLFFRVQAKVQRIYPGLKG